LLAFLWQRKELRTRRRLGERREHALEVGVELAVDDAQ
jgi:hypothetical protein